ncbi:MAG TPA: HEAT repeat domain-containing protein [Candidatus Obscuribacterales bacterium]
MRIDWKALATELGTSGEGSEFASTALAEQALEIIIGTDELRAAVDYYISSAPGYELARSVLWHLRLPSAMEYCYQIYRSEADLSIRRRACELLRAIADHRALPWAEQLLSDEDPEIQGWGGAMVDQLMYCRLVDPDQCADLLKVMSLHPNKTVRQFHDYIQQYLQNSIQTDKTDTR